MTKSRNALAAIAMVILAACAGRGLETAPVEPPLDAPGSQLGPGLRLIPGALLPGRGPDGNTVVFDAPEGLIVVDTGRHPFMTDQIIAYAQARNQPVAAVVNTHWHLDHTSGNARIKAAYPGARVYATNAIERALTGFLASDYRQGQAVMADEASWQALPPVRREEIELFMSTIDNAGALRPDVVVGASGPLRIAGRTLDVHVTDHAVTDADIWIFDTRTNTAVVGDLVTLPAPFLDTACPDRWSAALAEVWATPFDLAVPGHGAPMRRAEFAAYRTAYDNLIACVGREDAPSACAAGWINDASQFLPEEGDRTSAQRRVEYYVGMLRENGGRSADCQVTP
ncbi:MAG: MBL fold metallo-hydrolase [Hyphomonadaceae bacterium]